jgi:adenylate cyclase
VVEDNTRRKLTTILATDIVGYSRLMSEDEADTLTRLKADLRDILEPRIAETRGRLIKLMGDGALIEFSSVVDAVNFSVDVQQCVGIRNKTIPENRRIEYRIGINVGDIIVDGDDIYGDGVNVAARLESLAPSGGICASAQVAKEALGKTDAEFSNAGIHTLKNISTPLEVWCWPKSSAVKLRRNRNDRIKGTTVGISIVIVCVIIALLFIFLRDIESASTSPRIAVIPFDNIGNNQDDAYFSDGLSKDINALLSKFSNLFVIASSSVRDFKGASCEEIVKELQADYILNGTVRRSASKLRVTTTFIDGKTCRQLDSPGPFDRNLDTENVFDIQLEIAKKVVAEVGSADAPLFNSNIQRTIRQKIPENLSTYECVLLSYWFYESFEPNRHRKAHTCLEKNLKIDVDYSLGWSRLASSYNESKKYAIDTPENWAELSRDSANRAISLDPDNPNAYYALAILTQMTTQNLDEFRSFAEKAIELNSNDAFVLADLGTWMGYAGQWQKAKEWVSKSMQLNPKHQSWLFQTWHLDHFLRGEYAKSRDYGLKMNLPKNYMVQASMTAAYAMNGEQKKAEETLMNLLELRPNYPDDPRAPFRARGMPTELVERIMQGLRKAGLEVQQSK